MTDLSDDTRLYLHHGNWHDEGECVIVRRKFKMVEPVILNALASEMWRIIQQGQWTVGKFINAVEMKLGRENQPTDELTREFLKKMIAEGLISTQKVSLFQDEP
jgi:hypothetical protein